MQRKQGKPYQNKVTVNKDLPPTGQKKHYNWQIHLRTMHIISPTDTNINTDNMKATKKNYAESDYRMAVVLLKLTVIEMLHVCLH